MSAPAPALETRAPPGDAAFAADDGARLKRVASHLRLLADLTHADVALFTPAGQEIRLVAQEGPAAVPSLYASPPPPRIVPREEASAVARVLFERARHSVSSTVIRGAPVLQEVLPVRGTQGQVIGAVCSEMALVEHERQRRQPPVFRRAIARARDLIVAGAMRGGDRLGRLGVHDGVMVVNAEGRIEYLSATAEYLYRRLGYADRLVKTQLQELDTNEYVCFRAIEQGTCLEQRIQEQDLVWIKRVIPFPALPPTGWLDGIMTRTVVPTGALVMIQDVTSELHKEQELRIKTAMIQEIHHRVKNNLQTLAALLRLQARRATEEAIADQLREAIGRIVSIAAVHEFLSHEETSIINMNEVANRILGEVRGGVLGSGSPITLTLEGIKDFTLPAQQATSCALILNELVQNAVDHAFAPGTPGRIVVRLAKDEDSLLLEVQDDGTGLTGTLDPARYGLGLQIVQTLVQEDLKGRLDIVADSGTKAVVSFPRRIAEG